MARPTHGWHPEKGDLDICVAAGCTASAELMSLVIPLCERHLVQAYGEILDYVQTKRSRAAEHQEPLSELLPVQWDWVGRQFGICPSCDLITLRRDRVSGTVCCAHNECGFTADRAEFDAMCQRRIDAMSAVVEVVYYVRFGDRVKIGTTTNLQQRLGNLPHDEVMATEPGGFYVERQRHEQFKHLRTRVGTSREWFTLTPELAAHIAAVKSRQAA